MIVFPFYTRKTGVVRRNSPLATPLRATAYVQRARLRGARAIGVIAGEADE
jgi:hypothetical protein